MVSGAEAQRREAVRRVLSGEPVAAVAADLGRSEGWVRKWVGRFEANDPGWATERSRAARTVTNRTPAEIENLVVKVRQELAADDWAQVGASAILWQLVKLDVGDPPSLRTIERILVRHDVERRNRRGRYEPKGTPYPRLEATAPGMVHQGDLVGPRYLEGGEVFYAVNVIDAATRAVAGEITRARSAEAVCRVIPLIWGRLGIPQRFQLDNQQALTGAKGQPGKLVRLCLTYGVTPVFIPVAEPWRNGIIEQFNNTFDKKFYRTERFHDIAHVANRYRQFEQFHNTRHRYSVLGGLTPDQIRQRAGYEPRPPDPDWVVPATFAGLTGTIEWVRLIRTDRTLRILQRSYAMPESVVHEYVTAVVSVEHQELVVYHHRHEISRHPFPLDHTIR